MLLNKIRLYKNLIVIFIALNVFSLALAVVFSVSYFKQKSKYYKSFQQSSLIVKQHLSFQQEAEALLLRTLNSEKSKNEQLYTFWQSYKQTLDTQNVDHTISSNITSKITNNITMDDWINKSIKDQKTWLKDQLTRSHLIVDEKLNLLDELQSNFQNIHTEFIVVGILTLLFGILLPLWVIGLATRLLYRAKIELEKKVLSVIKEFSTAHGLYEKPFQSPEFWFKTTSLVLENIALYTSHPGVHTAADLSRHIRQELEKHKN